MNRNRIFISLASVLLLAVIAAGCSGEPLLTQLSSSRVQVIIKGTYESNSPRRWIWPSLSEFPFKVVDDSVSLYPVSVSAPPPDFMLDLTGMELKNDLKTSEFGNTRRTYRCSTSDENADFFNGTGIYIEGEDVPSNRNFTCLDLYIRKMLFSETPKYELRDEGWFYDNFYQTYFEEKKVGAFNFNLNLVNYFYDTLRVENDGDDTNRIYPIHINVANGIFIPDTDEKTVLEVRLVIKNFIKLYEYNRLDYSSSDPFLVHYYGISDWLRDVRRGETLIGGNLLAVARSYVPGKTAAVSGNIGREGYIIGIPAGSDINDYTLPDLEGDPTLRSHYIKYADIPSEPSAASESCPAILEYFGDLEIYKNRWNNFLSSVLSAPDVKDTVTAQQFFEKEWTEYNDAAENFRIAPLAVYTEDGSFTVENIAPGTYDFYRTKSGCVPGWGELFSHGAFELIEDSVTLAEGDSTEL